MKNKIWLHTLIHSLLISFAFVLGTRANSLPLESSDDTDTYALQLRTLPIKGVDTELSSGVSGSYVDFPRLAQNKNNTLGDPPSNGGVGGNGTGSRGQCATEASLQSLTPTNGIGVVMQDSAAGLYFFIPKGSVRPDESSANDMGQRSRGIEETITFRISDMSTDDVIYTSKLTLNLPTLLNIDLTKANPPITLTAGQTYKWELTLNCDLTEMVDEYPRVSGLMRKIDNEPDFLAESETVAMVDRPLFFADMGLQYDAIAALIELIQTEPDNPNIEAIWQELLPETSLGLIKPALISESQN